ncbi:MAG: hypothetical protein IKX10_02255 [Lachnospiraceae bacterium]|nr:hypothetical protein [Lachnospiraceae bacterium]
MEKMKRRTPRGASNSLGRLWAGLLAVLLVIGLVPEAVTVTINAAELTSTTANAKIKDILGKGDYVPQITRTRERRSTKPNDTYIYNGGYYYSTKSTNLYDEDKKEYYSGAGGICTWCAFTNLLNRKIALDGGSKAVFEANKYDILNVAKRIGNTNEGVRFSVSGQNDYIWIGNKRSFADVYSKSFDNGKGRSYTGYTEEKVNNVPLNSTKDLKDDDLTKRINEIKEKLKNELDAHPEGIVIQFSKDSSNMHGIVLTGYYDDQGYLSFYTVDTAGTYGDGFTPIESSHLGTHYGNENFQGVKKIDNIVKYITSYVYIKSASGSLDIPDPNAPVSINNLSIDGKTGTITLPKGYAHLMGTVTSGSAITSVNAKIEIGGVEKYNKTISPYTTTVDLKESTLNRGTECIQFGGFDPGTYTLTVTAEDQAGNKDTEIMEFTIASEGGSAVSNTSSNSIKISDLKLEGGNTFEKGSPKNLCGTITSDYDIKEVVAEVNGKKYGPITPKEQQTVNYRRIDLKTSALNSSLGGKYSKYISFGGFSKGTYTLKITVTDKKQNMETAEFDFTVTDPNSISIDLSGFAYSQKYGKSYNIPGTVKTTTANIKMIEARVIDAQSGSYYASAKYCKDSDNGKNKKGQKVEKTIYPNSKSVNLTNTDINSISMGCLAYGYYYFEVKVTDVLGNTAMKRVAFQVK